ncbi:MAG: peptidoglycan-binding protein [Hamadaea sp.]|uniref:peptidoglycan-binding domain-containing protein n=1 Tax=Hamadaea sp. TaxID=2024425 RepID=UPI00184AD1B1|nr:peptidoglycan-binding domain-containing protein [Hamadaea sp.]NUR70084.1 peptidoglycan-binding protein [Hamadaea sp.]NUT23424.1 peptidoglycan-binding protein [Hamadaea sp.]
MNSLVRSARSRTVAVATRLAVAFALVLGGALVAPPPASAATGYYGVLTLCKQSSCVNTGNVVRFWQRRLWADVGYDDVDGVFGPNTESATLQWQQLYNSYNSPDIPVDGWAGPKTWEASNLNPVWGFRFTSQDSTYVYYDYIGRRSGRFFKIRERLSDRVSWFRMPTEDTWTDTSYVN